MRDLFWKLVLLLLVLTYAASPFLWGYGVIHYLPPRARFLTAFMAAAWSIPMFFELKESRLFDFGIYNGIAILISLPIRNIPYIFFRIFYIWEAVFYAAVFFCYLREIKRKWL